MNAFCPRCGRPLDPGTRFCTMCGAQQAAGAVVDVARSSSSLLRRAAIPLVTLAIAVTVTIVVALPGSGRSVEAFCRTYETEKQAYITKYDERGETIDNSEGLEGLLIAGVSLIEMMGDMVRFFDKLEAVAPTDIQTDVEAVRDSLQKQMDRAGEMVTNPLAGIAGGLMDGLSAQGSWTRLESYITTNCGTT